MTPIHTALFDAIRDAMEGEYYGDEETLNTYAKDATDAAMKACGPRELVWESFYDDELNSARPYDIWITNGLYQLSYWQIDVGEPHPTLEAAKAAAQSHADAAHWANTVIGAEVGK